MGSLPPAARPLSLSISEGKGRRRFQIGDVLTATSTGEQGRVVLARTEKEAKILRMSFWLYLSVGHIERRVWYCVGRLCTIEREMGKPATIKSNGCKLCRGRRGAEFSGCLAVGRRFRQMKQLRSVDGPRPLKKNLSSSFVMTNS